MYDPYYEVATVSSTYYKRERDIPGLSVEQIVLPGKGWSTIRLQNAGALFVSRVPTVVKAFDKDAAQAQHSVNFLARSLEIAVHRAARKARKFKIKLRRAIHRKARRTAKWGKYKLKKQSKVLYRKYRQGRFTILQAVSHEWKVKRIIPRFQPIEAPITDKNRPDLKIRPTYIQSRRWGPKRPLWSFKPLVR